MAELTKEQLIELITKEVLRTLGGGEPEEPPDKSGLPLAPGGAAAKAGADPVPPGFHRGVPGGYRAL